MEKFFTILAWIFGIWCSINVVCTLIVNFLYQGSINQKLDRIKGEEKLGLGYFQGKEHNHVTRNTRNIHYRKN